MGESNIDDLLSYGKTPRAHERLVLKRKPVRMMNGDNLPLVARPLRSEMSQRVVGHNAATQVELKKKVGWWFTEQNITLNKLRRGQNAVYKTMLRVNQDKKRFARETHKRRQEEHRRLSNGNQVLDTLKLEGEEESIASKKARNKKDGSDDINSSDLDAENKSENNHLKLDFNNTVTTDKETITDKPDRFIDRNNDLSPALPGNQKSLSEKQALAPSPVAPSEGGLQNQGEKRIRVEHGAQGKTRHPRIKVTEESTESANAGSPATIGDNAIGTGGKVDVETSDEGDKDLVDLTGQSKSTFSDIIRDNNVKISNGNDQEVKIITIPGASKSNMHNLNTFQRVSPTIPDGLKQTIADQTIFEEINQVSKANALSSQEVKRNVVSLPPLKAATMKPMPRKSTKSPPVVTEDLPPVENTLRTKLKIGLPVYSHTKNDCDPSDAKEENRHSPSDKKIFENTENTNNHFTEKKPRHRTRSLSYEKPTRLNTVEFNKLKIARAEQKRFEFDESCVVYRRNSDGSVVPIPERNFKRAEFKLPSRHEERVRKRLLASQREAYRLQAERLQQFYDQLDKEIGLERRHFHAVLPPEEVIDLENQFKPEDVNMGNFLNNLMLAFRQTDIDPNVDPNSPEALRKCRYIRLYSPLTASQREQARRNRLSSWAKHIFGSPEP